MNRRVLLATAYWPIGFLAILGTMALFKVLGRAQAGFAVALFISAVGMLFLFVAGWPHTQVANVFLGPSYTSKPAWPAYRLHLVWSGASFMLMALLISSTGRQPLFGISLGISALVCSVVGLVYALQSRRKA